jgi:plastocyanin
VTGESQHAGRQRGLSPQRLGALCTGVAIALAAAPAAHADGQIAAGPPNRYLTSDVTIDQGERVTFMNTDTADHDVLARDKGGDGKPLFRSELVGAGRTVPVVGTEYLTTGSFSFFCSLHPQMEGTLKVSSAGTPVPRPGSGGGGGGGGAPSLGLRVLDLRLARIQRQQALPVRVQTDEGAAVRITARRGRTTLAKGTVKLSAAGSRTVRLKLTPAGRRVVRQSSKVRVSISARAEDADGNATTKKAAATLRRS